jgi:hypothetical protein
MTQDRAAVCPPGRGSARDRPGRSCIVVSARRFMSDVMISTLRACLNQALQSAAAVRAPELAAQTERNRSVWRPGPEYSCPNVMDSVALTAPPRLCPCERA